VQELINNLISGTDDVRFSHVAREASKHITFSQAASALQQQHAVPKDVSSLLARTSANTSQALTEESLTKARNFLNGLIEAAFVELDAKIIEAKEFEAKNRGTWQQVVADIARLGQQIADHIRRAAEATACIASVTRQIDDVKARRQEEYEAYMKEYNIHYADMQIKQNDLDFSIS
jgi:rhamnose utilization protein RhaD (predicted bifunctional aldolase and dehydrogenase)